MSVRRAVSGTYAVAESGIGRCPFSAERLTDIEVDPAVGCVVAILVGAMVTVDFDLVRCLVRFAAVDAGSVGLEAAVLIAVWAVVLAAGSVHAAFVDVAAALED